MCVHWMCVSKRVHEDAHGVSMCGLLMMWGGVCEGVSIGVGGGVVRGCCEM